MCAPDFPIAYESTKTPTQVNSDDIVLILQIEGGMGKGTRMEKYSYCYCIYLCQFWGGSTLSLLYFLYRLLEARSVVLLQIGP